MFLIYVNLNLKKTSLLNFTFKALTRDVVRISYTTLVAKNCTYFRPDLGIDIRAKL